MMRRFFSLTLTVALFALGGCGGDNEAGKRDVSLLFCDEAFGVSIDFPDYVPDRSTSVIDAATLAAAISINGEVRAYPGGMAVTAAATGTGPTVTLVNPKVPVFDRSFVDLVFEVTGNTGYRLKAIFLEIVDNGTPIGTALMAPVSSVNSVGANRYRLTLVGPLTDSNTQLISSQAVTDIVGPWDTGVDGYTVNFTGGTFGVADSIDIVHWDGVTATTLVDGIHYNVSADDQITLLGAFDGVDFNGVAQELRVVEAVALDFSTVTLSYAGFFVPENEFSPDLSVDTFDGYDDPTRWSAPGSSNLQVSSVGVGVVQIGISWDTGPETGSGNVDLDLWLDEPDGNLIYYANGSSVAAPLSNCTLACQNLDTDNTTGYGPENIYFDTDPPAGTYSARVNYFSGSQVTNWVAVVSDCGTSEVYRGTVSSSGGNAGEKDILATWTHTAGGIGCTLPDSTPVAPPRPETTLYEKSVCQALYGASLNIP